MSSFVLKLFDLFFHLNYRQADISLLFGWQHYNKINAEYYTVCIYVYLHMYICTSILWCACIITHRIPVEYMKRMIFMYFNI